MLAVGGIEPRKGTLDLLEAFALARETLPDLELVVAGGETLFDYRDYRAAFDARAVELGVEPHVLGPVDHDVLPGLVAGCRRPRLRLDQGGLRAGGDGGAGRRGPRGRPAAAGPAGGVRRPRPLRRGPGGRSPPPSLEAVADGPLPGGAALARRHTWRAAAERHLDLYRSLSTAQVPVR